MTNEKVIELVQGIKDEFSKSVNDLKKELHDIVVNQEKRLTAIETTQKNIWYAFLFITTVLTLIVGFLALKA